MEYWNFQNNESSIPERFKNHHVWSVVLLANLFILNFNVVAQDLFNNEPDTLQKFGTIYYSTVVERSEHKTSLTDGYYVLIFDHKVDLNEIGLQIVRKMQTPILYQRHNGYFSFEVKNSSTAYLKFRFPDDMKVHKGTFARIYRVTPTVIDTYYPPFNLKDIDGNEYSNHDFLGHITLFLLWSSTSSRHQKFLKQLENLVGNDSSINIVAISYDFPKQQRTVRDDNNLRSILVSDNANVLSNWAEIIGGLNLFIVDEKGFLQYKNRINGQSEILISSILEGVADRVEKIK